MAIEHKNIPNSELHETKGVSSASTGEVHVCQSTGTSEWRKLNYSELVGSPTFSLALSQTLYAEHTSNQIITTENTVAKVLFGAAQEVDDAKVGSDGVIEFKTNGIYLLQVELCVGKVNGTTSSSIYLREVFDDGTLPSTPVTSRIFPSPKIKEAANITDVIVLQSVVDVTNGQKVWYEHAHSSNQDVGFLVNTVPAAVGWSASPITTPSASVTIYRFAG